MSKFVKTIIASSIVISSLAGTASSATAAEPAMPHQPTMMQGQAPGSAMPGVMPGAESGMKSGAMEPGAGKMGSGCRMGKMGGGMGQGMMGGGMGQGMMGGGMSQGMMGGGMGQGMMGGAMGPGMMAALNLTDAQATQLEKIQTESMKKQRAFMRQMWDEQEMMSDLLNAEKRDPTAIGKTYGKLADLQRQALEARIDGENKAAAVLTKEQKAQMRRGLGRSMMGQ